MATGDRERVTSNSASPPLFLLPSPPTTKRLSNGKKPVVFTHKNKEEAREVPSWVLPKLVRRYRNEWSMELTRYLRRSNVRAYRLIQGPNTYVEIKPAQLNIRV